MIHWHKVLTAVDCVVPHVEFDVINKTKHTFIFPSADCAGNDETVSVSLVLGLQTHAISSGFSYIHLGDQNNIHWLTV